VPPRPRPELLADIRGPAGQRLQGADAAPVRQPAGGPLQAVADANPPPLPPRPVRPAVGANPANVANANGANAAAANAAPPTRLQRAIQGFFQGTELKRSALPEAERFEPNLTPSQRAQLEAATLTVQFDGFKAAAIGNVSGFKKGEFSALQSELIGRTVDVAFALGIAAGYQASGESGIAGLNWIMTGRYGKTNPGQAGRSAVASATSLQLAANGRQLRLLGSPIDTRTVNTGPRERSLIGVPRAVDPLENFALIAASIGKDQPFLIRG
jgi:hypothetical protein